jgi:hypothetical protein
MDARTAPLSPKSTNSNPNNNNNINNNRTRQEVQPFYRAAVSAPSMQGMACVWEARTAACRVAQWFS